MKGGRVAIVGAGGIGAPAAAALAAAGISGISLWDPDVVELSNLPRQPLYGAGDVGRPKVEVAAGRIRARHPRIEVTAHQIRIDERSAPLLADHAAIVDGTDGIAAKALLNEAALALGVPLVHAGAIGLEGQLTTILPHRTACLRCLFVELPDPEEMPGCQQAGILGPVVGAIGLAAAREALALVDGREPALANRLAIFSGARVAWRIVDIRPNSRCPSCRAG
ncbi:MAG TPA: ThiF family adenylyltransferase [Candidatus Binatia bacterium]|nr:ThiF family adenylyltransferase [Candidatus Binatia bacterium]